MIAVPPHETSEALPCSAVSVQQRREMLDLLSSYFDGVDPGQFEHDLAEKNWVIHLRRGGRLVGFSTLLATESLFEGAPITAVFSGDTIVAPEAWGTPSLAKAWIATVNGICAKAPERPCYWLLLTSGFRTYRFLPVFWREFYPRHDASTPPDAGRLMRSLASERYGNAYSEETGIVRFPRPQVLRASLGTVPEGRKADPHVEFFLRRNPGHMLGDELVCITEISGPNMTPAGRRMVLRTP
jgi:hypothetical protein